MSRTILVNDKMQKGYRYELVKRARESFDPEFKPGLTPKQMLEMRVFGGKYMTDCKKEFPSSWFEKAKFSPKFHDRELNFFKINASQPLSYWRKKGWKAMKRHIAQLKKNCEKGNWDCRPRQRQTLLHWAYDSRKL